MKITFFATDADLLQVAEWFFDIPGMRLLEAYSRFDQPNRWFASADELAPLVATGHWGFSGWLEPAGGRPRSRYITFDSDTQKRYGAKGRTNLMSPALIGAFRDNDQLGSLGAAHISCWNEKGARQRSIYPDEFLDEIDWKALRASVSSIQRRLKKAAPSKLSSYPIMPEAFRKLQAGELTLWNWGSACGYPSPLITEA